MSWICNNGHKNPDDEDRCRYCNLPKSENFIQSQLRQIREKRAAPPYVPINYAKRNWKCEVCGAINPGFSAVCKNYNNPKLHPEASALRAAGRSVAGAGGRAGGAVKSALGIAGGPLRAVADIATNWSSTIRENVRAKTVESVILLIAAVVLVSFGFIWAAVGILFFMFYLYLPSEEDVMTRARQQAGKKGASGSFNKMIEEVQERLIDINEEIKIAELSQDAKTQIELRREGKGLLKQLTNIAKQVDASKDMEEKEKNEIRNRVDEIIRAEYD